MAVRRLTKIGLAGIVTCLAVAGCAARIDSRGNLPDEEALARIKIGDVSKTEVQEILGSPSSVAAFNDNEWYYISKKTETVAFYRPKVVERQVLILRFDQKGVLKEMEALDQNAGREVELVKRETATAGNEITVLQQLFGNFGRFNKDKATTSKK
jgi:outer membrane protein assembly factor BamE (lipoprotein component of BamABCDE complex)